MTGRLSEVSKERPSAVRLPRRLMGVMAFAVGYSAYAERALGQDEAPRLSYYSCPDAMLRRDAPAKWEWAYWLGGGALLRPERKTVQADVGLGAEITTPLLHYYLSNLEVRELRFGLWTSGHPRRSGGLVEGGGKIHWGPIGASFLRTFDFRVGGGYGWLPSGNLPHLNMTILWGARIVPGRNQRWGYCDEPPLPPSILQAGVLRLFATYRRSFGGEPGSEFVFGVEIAPRIFLPPYY